MLSANLPTPLCKPVDKVSTWQFLARHLNAVRVNRLLQHLPPRVALVVCNPFGQVAQIQQFGGFDPNPLHQFLSFTQSPDANRVLVGHLHRDLIELTPCPDRIQIPPLPGDNGTIRPLPIVIDLT